MEEERKENVEDTEEVEAHKRFGPSEEPAARTDQGAEDDEVEAHNWQKGPEEFGKRYKRY
jgi:hypothetical protein